MTDDRECRKCQHERVAIAQHPVGHDGKFNRKRSYCFNCGITVKNQRYCHNCGCRLLWNKSMSETELLIALGIKVESK